MKNYWMYTRVPAAPTNGLPEDCAIIAGPPHGPATYNLDKGGRVIGETDARRLVLAYNATLHFSEKDLLQICLERDKDGAFSIQHLNNILGGSIVTSSKVSNVDTPSATSQIMVIELEPICESKIPKSVIRFDTNKKTVNIDVPTCEAMKSGRLSIGLAELTVNRARFIFDSIFKEAFLPMNFHVERIKC